MRWSLLVAAAFLVGCSGGSSSSSSGTSGGTPSTGAASSGGASSVTGGATSNAAAGTTGPGSSSGGSPATSAGASGTAGGAGTTGGTSSGTSGGACTNLSFVALPHTAVGEQPFGLAVADYNGDGIPDFAVSNYVQNSISLVLGLGDAGVDGGFATAFTFDAGQPPRQLAAVDYNKDGRPDLVIPLYNSTLAAFPNQGTWSSGPANGFGPAMYYPIIPAACPGAVVAADMNKDGWPDIVFSDSCYRQVGVMLNLTDGGGFSAPVVFPALNDMGYLVVADFNGDGWPDVATTSSINDNINIFSNTQVWTSGGTSGLGNQIVIPNSSQPGSIAVGDFNGDGWPDLVVVNGVSNTGMNGVVVYLNLTDGGFPDNPLPFFTGGNPISVAVGDFNQDKMPDLAVATGAALQVLLNTGAWSSNGGDAGFGPLLFVDGGVTNTWVDVEDLNGDGWPDITVLGGTDDGYVSAFINTCGPQ